MLPLLFSGLGTFLLLRSYPSGAAPVAWLAAMLKINFQGKYQTSRGFEN